MQNYRKHPAPTRFPASLTFYRPAGGEEQPIQFDFLVADLAAYEAFKMNARNIDPVALKAAAKEAGQAGVTEEMLRTVLAEGQVWRAKVELVPDGQTEKCTGCGRKFQPVLIPYENSQGQGVGGNFRTLKDVIVQRLPRPGALDDAKEMTARRLGPGDHPKSALLVVVCVECRAAEHAAKIFNRYFSSEAAIANLFEVDGKIADAADRRQAEQYRQGFVEKAQFRGPNRRIGERRSEATQYQGRDQRLQGERREAPKENWHGADLHVPTVEALKKAVKAGHIGDSLEALRDAPVARLLELGIVRSDNAAEQVQRIARVVLARTAQQAQQAHAGSFSLADAKGSKEVAVAATAVVKTTPVIKTPPARSRKTTTRSQRSA